MKRKRAGDEGPALVAEQMAASVVLTLALLVLLAYLAYRLVEKPGMRLGAKLVARINDERRLPATRRAG